MSKQKVYYAGSCEHGWGAVLAGPVTDPRKLQIFVGRIGENMGCIDRKNDIFNGFLDRVGRYEMIRKTLSISAEGQLHQFTELDPGQFHFEDGILTLV